MSPIAFAAFVAGFAVADITGVRPLGGLVLAAGGAYCFVAVRRAAGTGRALAVLVLALALFVAAHPLGDVIGAWPAALLAGAATALAVRASAA